MAEVRKEKKQRVFSFSSSFEVAPSLHLSLSQAFPSFFFLLLPETPQHRRLRRAFSALPLSIFTPYENLPADGRVSGMGNWVEEREREKRDERRESFFFPTHPRPFLQKKLPTLSLPLPPSLKSNHSKQQTQTLAEEACDPMERNCQIPMHVWESPAAPAAGTAAPGRARPSGPRGAAGACALLSRRRTAPAWRAPGWDTCGSRRRGWDRRAGSTVGAGGKGAEEEKQKTLWAR